MAIPSIILMADWFPALPPAPTSMVRKTVMMTWRDSISSYRCSTIPDTDCSTRRHTSHTPRSCTSSHKLLPPLAAPCVHARISMLSFWCSAMRKLSKST